VRFRYDPGLVELIKAAVPSYARRYDPAAKEWTVEPATPARWRGCCAAREHGCRPRIAQRHYVIRSVAVRQRAAKRIGPARHEPVFKALTRGGLRLAYADFDWEMLEVGLRDDGRIQWVHIASSDVESHGLTFEWRPADSLPPVDVPEQLVCPVSRHSRKMSSQDCQRDSPWLQRERVRKLCGSSENRCISTCFVVQSATKAAAAANAHTSQICALTSAKTAGGFGCRAKRRSQLLGR
jgi:hypothetical protein